MRLKCQLLIKKNTVNTSEKVGIILDWTKKYRGSAKNVNWQHLIGLSATHDEEVRNCLGQLQN